MHRLRAPRPGRALAAALVLAGLLPAPVLGAPSAADQGIAAAERWVEGAAATPDDYVELASAFMRKSRESGDPGYYARANAAVERALALDPNHYGALRTAPWCCSACTTSAARWPWRSAPGRSSPRTGGTTARWPTPMSSWAT